MEDNILEYSPELSIGAKKSTYIDKHGNEINNEVIDNSFPCSVNVTAFKANKPCECIKIANDLLKSSKDRLSKLKEDISKNKQGNDFILGETDKVYKENFDDIYGDTRIEAYRFLSDIVIELEKIKQAFQFFVYGTDANDEDFSEYDESILNSIKYYEKNNSMERIDYFILFYIIQMSHLFKSFLLELSNITCSLSFLNDYNLKDGESRTINDILEEFLNKEFDDINRLLKFDISKDDDIDINIINIISSIGLDVEKLDLLIDAMGEYIDGPQSDKMIFSDMRNKAEKEISKKILDLYKSFKFYILCKSDYIEDLHKKMKIRAFLI